MSVSWLPVWEDVGSPYRAHPKIIQFLYMALNCAMHFWYNTRTKAKTRINMTIKKYTELVLNDRLDNFLRRVISRRSRGNVRLQRGSILSSMQYANQKKQVLSYVFR